MNLKFSRYAFFLKREDAVPLLNLYSNCMVWRDIWDKLTFKFFTIKFMSH